MERKHVLILLVLGLGVIVLFGLFSGTKKPVVEPDPKTDLTKPYKEERVVSQDAKTTLAAFPADFPLEAGAEQTSSYKFVPANALTQQSTIEYISKKSMPENQKIFADYLAAGGYTIINKIEQPGLYFYYGQRSDHDLTIKIAEQDGKVLVGASFVQK